VTKIHFADVVMAMVIAMVVAMVKTMVMMIVLAMVFMVPNAFTSVGWLC